MLLRDDGAGPDDAPPALTAPVASGAEPRADDAALTPATRAEASPLASPTHAPVRLAEGAPRPAGDAPPRADDESATAVAARELAASVAERLGLGAADARDLAELMVTAARERKALAREMAEAGHDMAARVEAGKRNEAATRSQREALSARFGEARAREILLALARGR